jgi:hypothetical protein
VLYRNSINDADTTKYKGYAHLRIKDAPASIRHGPGIKNATD